MNTPRPGSHGQWAELLEACDILRPIGTGLPVTGAHVAGRGPRTGERGDDRRPR